MERIIGFIGYGNMAKAMVSGLIKSGTFAKENIIASKRNISLEDRTEKVKIYLTEDNKEVAEKADFIVLATKPNSYALILEEIGSYIKKDAIIISIGAGISSGFLRDNLPQGVKHIKTMPNTPAMVGEGMTAISINETLGKKDIENIEEIFSSFGKTEIIDESLMDGFTALCGSSPAYIYMMIEAMADGGVLEGIPRDKAYRMAAQTVLGSAKMVLETGLSPSKLKDNVASPGGTTIEAIATLEEQGFRFAVMKAMKACAKKSKEMSK